MKRAAWVLSLASGTLLLAGAVNAQEESPLPKGFTAVPVLKAGKTATGDPLVYLQTQKPEVVSVVATLEPKGQTAVHRHPVPVFVYILEGQLIVRDEGKERREYKAGEAFLETVGMWHQAFNEGDQHTKILVVFFGEEGKPTTEAKQ